MIAYSVIESDSEQYMAQQVSNALNEGWTLAGQLTLVIDHTGKHHFAQALIRPDPGVKLIQAQPMSIREKIMSGTPLTKEDWEKIPPAWERFAKIEEPPRCYEIISLNMGSKVGTVIGVCVDPSDHDERDDIYGLLTEEQYDQFNERAWTRPKSTRRFRLVPQPKKLEEIKQP